MTQSQETRILIVDSEPQTSKVLSGWLEAEGYECVLAGDVDEASERLEQGGGSQFFWPTSRYLKSQGLNGSQRLKKVILRWRSSWLPEPRTVRG